MLRFAALVLVTTLWFLFQISALLYVRSSSREPACSVRTTVPRAEHLRLGMSECHARMTGALVNNSRIGRGHSGVSCFYGSLMLALSARVVASVRDGESGAGSMEGDSEHLPDGRTVGLLVCYALPRTGSCNSRVPMPCARACGARGMRGRAAQP